MNGVERSERIAGAEKYVARGWLRRGSGLGILHAVGCGTAWRLGMLHAFCCGAAWRLGILHAKSLRRSFGLWYVARSCMQSNARVRCAAYNGGRNTSPHTKTPFNSVHSVPLRSGACLLLAPNLRGLADKRANCRLVTHILR